MSSDTSHTSSFPPGQYSALAHYEDTHWWFLARNLLIHWALSTYVSMKGSFLEIGCGTGFVTYFLERKYPNVKFTASELHQEGLYYARKRLHRALCLELDAVSMSSCLDYNNVGCFDVLEHIHPDDMVIRNIHKSLKDGGSLILTVPQHMFLWSVTDTVAGHKRRYSRRDLLLKLQKSGFRIRLATSFVTLLFPLLVFIRFLARNKQYDAEIEFDLPPLVNSILYLIMRIEFLLISIGARFPFGGSLLVVAQKRS